jgi:predicted RNA-binding protein YlqC (UPF0109 family)
MLKPNSLSNQNHPTTPDYLGLVEFLVEPLLESPDSLSIDCERANNNQRVWVRVAFEETDKGRVFGRGGRNLLAIRTVLSMAAAEAGQSVHLDIYEGNSEGFHPNPRNHYSNDRKFVKRKPRSGPPNSPNLSVKSRWQQ